LEKILGLTFFHGIQLPASTKVGKSWFVREITSLR